MVQNEHLDLAALFLFFMICFIINGIVDLVVNSSGQHSHFFLAEI